MRSIRNESYLVFRSRTADFNGNELIIFTETWQLKCPTGRIVVFSFLKDEWHVYMKPIRKANRNYSVYDRKL